MRVASWRAGRRRTYRISERHARGLVKLAIGTQRYQSRKVFDEVLRHLLRELAGTHVCYRYWRLTVLLRREGWHVNAKRIYRLYREDELIVRTKQRRKMARRQRATTRAMAARPNQCWRMDFVSDKFTDGRSFRILTVVISSRASVLGWKQTVRWKPGQWETTCSYVYPAGSAGREWIHREFQRPTPGRVFEHGVVFLAARRAAETGEVPRSGAVEN